MNPELATVATIAVVVMLCPMWVIGGFRLILQLLVGFMVLWAAIYTLFQFYTWLLS